MAEALACLAPPRRNELSSLEPIEERQRWRAMPREVKERLEVKKSSRLEDKSPDWRSHRVAGLQSFLGKNPSLEIHEYVSLMRKCGRQRSLQDAKLVHQHLRKHSPALLHSTFIGNTLIQMYGRCRSPADARKGFQAMEHGNRRNSVSWSIMVECLVHNGLYSEALEVYSEMNQRKALVDAYTISAILVACTRSGDLDRGMLAHRQASQLGLVCGDVYVSTALIHMYSRSSKLEAAVRVFESMKDEVVDSVSTTAMIGAYVRNGEPGKALDLYWWLRSCSDELDAHTYAAVLGGCSSPELLVEGRQIHRHIVEGREHYRNINVKNALITMYSRCGCLEDAELIFEGMDVKDVVTWNSMIAAYAQNGESTKALQLFQRMEMRNVPADVITFTSVLSAVTGEEMLRYGRRVHREIANKGLFPDEERLLSCVIGMYARCGSIGEARKVFDVEGGGVEQQMGISTWNRMIAGYAQLDRGTEALTLYRQMLLQGIRPDRYTLSSVVDSCAALGAFREGRAVHECSVCLGVQRDSVLATALVNMYGKSGCLEEARQVFNGIDSKDTVSWSAMLAANAQNGHGRETLQLSYEMNQEGIQQNVFSASSILHGCTHEGLLFEGIHYFLGCGDDFNMELSVAVYVGFVDLLGRAGWLQEAECLVRTKAMDSFVAWVTLLGACRLHGNAKIGKVAAKQLMSMEPGSTGPYMLLNNIYAALGMWEDAAKLRSYMKKKSFPESQPALSSIEVGNKVHCFTAGDKSHDRNEAIRTELRKLHAELRTRYRYRPDTSEVFYDVSEAEKEDLLMFHSEKMAMAFGLLTSRPGTTLRIVKNLRVCSDCHTVGKLVSHLMSLNIVIRDGTRFHQFRDGQCSCRDCW